MLDSFRGKKVTIMGLGLHGGGSASAAFFAKQGAIVTVTDLRSREVLQKSIDELSDYKIRYVLGRHDEDDFFNADIVIKNPAVKQDSPFLNVARLGNTKIETDISIFLGLNKRPVIAVTGSKGKSTTVSALNHVLKKHYPNTNLGGNITVSPLVFFDEEKNESNDPVILELSSWQLADLSKKRILKPKISVITNIMHDHQDRYHSMEDYIADKAVIFEAQKNDSPLFLNYDSEYTDYFVKKSNCSVFFFSFHPLNKGINGAFIDNYGWWVENGIKTKILNSKNTLKGVHNKMNLLIAAAVLFKFGVPEKIIRNSLEEFSGIAHRLEFIRKHNGVKWYNDSAATIPEAAAAAVKSFFEPIHLIIGGTDKELDFSPLVDAISETQPASVSLLAGSGTDKIIKLLKEREINYNGPFNSLKKTLDVLSPNLIPGHSVLLSPGCASFGMFKNEFDRGDTFKKIVNNL